MYIRTDLSISLRQKMVYDFRLYSREMGTRVESLNFILTRDERNKVQTRGDKTSNGKEAWSK